MGDERKPPTLKDVINIGLALATSAVELAEQKVSQLVQRGKLSAEEGKKMLGDLRKRGEERAESIRRRVETEVQAALKKMDLVMKKDLEALRAEVRELKRQLRSKS